MVMVDERHNPEGTLDVTITETASAGDLAVWQAPHPSRGAIALVRLDPAVGLHPLAEKLAEHLSPDGPVDILDQSCAEGPWSLDDANGSLIRSQRARAMMRRIFGDLHIEQLPVDFSCVSADPATARPIHHRTGLLAGTVGPSMSSPVEDIAAFHADDSLPHASPACIQAQLEAQLSGRMVSQ